jgi:hypothetical protein
MDLSSDTPMDDDIELALDVGEPGQRGSAPPPEPQSGAGRAQAQADSRAARTPQTGAQPKPAQSGKGAAEPSSKAMTAPIARRPAPVSPLERIKVPLLVGFGGIVVALLEQIYTSVTGELVTIGPLRATYIAGMLITVGVLMVMKRLIFADDER